MNPGGRGWSLGQGQPESEFAGEGWCPLKSPSKGPDGGGTTQGQAVSWSVAQIRVSRVTRRLWLKQKGNWVGLGETDNSSKKLPFAR